MLRTFLNTDDVTRTGSFYGTAYVKYKDHTCQYSGLLTILRHECQSATTTKGGCWLVSDRSIVAPFNGFSSAVGSNDATVTPAEVTQGVDYFLGFTGAAGNSPSRYGSSSPGTLYTYNTGTTDAPLPGSWGTDNYQPSIKGLGYIPPTISGFNNGDPVTDGATSVPVSGEDFVDSEGDPAFYLCPTSTWDTETAVLQTLESASDGSAYLTIDTGALSGTVYAFAVAALGQVSDGFEVTISSGGAGITASAESVMLPPTGSLAGDISITASAESVMLPPTGSLAGDISITASAESVMLPPTGSLAGDISITASAESVLLPPIGSLAGDISITASAESVLLPLTGDLAGDIEISGIVALAESVLLPITGSLAGDISITASAESYTLPLSGSLAGDISIMASVESVLLPIAGSLAGDIPELIATVESVLLPLAGSLVGNISIIASAGSVLSPITGSLVGDISFVTIQTYRTQNIKLSTGLKRIALSTGMERIKFQK